MRTSVGSDGNLLVEGVKGSLLSLPHKDEGGKAVPCVRVVPVLRVFVAAAADPVDLWETRLMVVLQASTHKNFYD